MSSQVKTILLVSLGAVVLIPLFVMGFVSDVQKTGVRLENQLNAQYKDNQNEMSAFRTSFYEQMGVAGVKTDKMDKVLSDTITGRYGDGASMDGKLVNAIAEAYPDLKGLDVYDKVMDHIQAGRVSFKEKQSKILDMLQNYDKWRQSGLVKPSVVKALGFPSNSLKASFNGKVLTGQAALDKMYEVILLKEVNGIYESGEDQVLRWKEAPES